MTSSWELPIGISCSQPTALPIFSWPTILIFFYEAETRGIALMLSGHTHGGQIRIRGGPTIVRHSRFFLDEGSYSYGSCLAVVSRGLGAVGLPWRIGADPEAVLIQIDPTTQD